MIITPTPCLIAPQNTSLREAIKLMNEKNTNYLLLTDEQAELIGVFTERDLLKRALEFASNNLWDRPISLVMNRAVKTLPIRLINTAPQFLLAHRIRHVPIVTVNDETLKNEIVGVVTDNNLFASWAKTQSLSAVVHPGVGKGGRKILGIASPDGNIWKILQQVFVNSGGIDTNRYQYTNLQTAAQLETFAKRCDAVVLDIDNAPSRFWLPALRYFIKNPGVDFVAVVADEAKHEDLQPTLLKLTTEQEGPHFYTKPLNITQLVTDLENHWVRKK